MPLGITLAVLQGPSRPSDLPFKVHAIDPGASECAAVADINRDGRLESGQRRVLVSGASLDEAQVSRGRVLQQLHRQFQPDADRRQRRRLSRPRRRVVVCAEDRVVEEPRQGRRVRALAGGGGATAAATWSSPCSPTSTTTAGRSRSSRNRTARRRPGSKCANGAWVKHVVSDRTYGHGIGVGDVNGDKRNDILTPRGWLEAPADPRTGPWTYHAAWESINAPPAPAPTGQPVAAPPASSGQPAAPPRVVELGFMHVARCQRRRPPRHRHGGWSRLRRVLVRTGRGRQVDAPFDRQRLVAGPRVDAGRSQRRRPTGSRHRQALHGAQRHRSG